MSDSSLSPAFGGDRGLVWARSASALLVVVLLAGLGVANIALRARWHEVEDGVLWGERGRAVTALDVAAGSAAARAGVRPDDVLVSINGSRVETPADVTAFE